MLLLKSRVAELRSQLLESIKAKAARNWIEMVDWQPSGKGSFSGMPEERSLYIMMRRKYRKCRLMDIIYRLLLTLLSFHLHTVSELLENTKES